MGPITQVSAVRDDERCLCFSGDFCAFDELLILSLQCPSMASEEALAKRTKLVASRVHWSHMELPEFITAQDQEAHGMEAIKMYFVSP